MLYWLTQFTSELSVFNVFRYITFRTGGALLQSTHFHDNNGKRDDHLFLFEGEIHWKEILETFSEVEYLGCFMLELRSRGEDPLAELLQALKCADRLRKLEEEIIVENNKGE